MKIEQCKNGLALISLQFKLKDIFKDVFKTAKFDTNTKNWTVSVKEQQKLFKFVKIIEDNIDEINQNNNDEKTLFNLNKKFNQLHFN